MVLFIMGILEYTYKPKENENNCYNPSLKNKHCKITFVYMYSESFFYVYIYEFIGGFFVVFFQNVLLTTVLFMATFFSLLFCC